MNRPLNPEDQDFRNKPRNAIILIAAIAFFDGLSETFNQIREPSEIFKFHVSWIIKTYSTVYMVNYFMYRALTTIPWGFFIDKYGRKTGAIISLSAVSTILLLSPVFDLGILYALQRMVNGLFVITRVLSTEICYDDKKHWSISITFFSWIFGFVVGPFLSYYILPFDSQVPGNFLVACLGFGLAFYTYKHLEETLGNDKSQYQVIEQGYDLHMHVSLYSDLEPFEFENSEERQDFQKKELLQEIQESKDHAETQMLPAFNQKNVLKLYYIYSLNTLYGSVLGELLTPWMHDAGIQQEVDLLNSDKAWNVFGRFLVPLSVCTLFVYPLIQERKSDSFILLLGHWLIAGVFCLLPLGETIDMSGYFGLTYWIWLLLGVRLVANYMTFCSIQRYVNDIYSSEKRGNINAMFLTVFFGVIVVTPEVTDFFFVWADATQEISTFNYWVAFLIMVALTLGGLRILNRLELVQSRQQHSNKLEQDEK